LARFVIDTGATVELARRAVEVQPEAELYAPTLWRSQTLSALYEAARDGGLAPDEALEGLAYVGRLRIRLLGDAVLRRQAWRVAEQLGLDTTYDAEYVALAQLQKCTLVSTDARWLKRVSGLVPTATIDVLH
jgi:predicted nucleic acid-binding protein